MKQQTLARIVSALVLAVTLFCGYALTVHILNMQQPKIRYADDTVPKDTGALENTVRSSPDSSISRLSLFPWRNSTKTLVGVMIENHEEARPHHRGLADALIIEEFFVEGFISRFIALFDAKEIPNTVGPVRSLRQYFIEASLPWTSIYFHIGGSPEALESTEESESITAFNGVYRDTYFTRKAGVFAPHDAFLSEDSIKELLEEVTDAREIRWPPYKTGRALSGSGASAISINFFNPLHDIEYLYDSWKQRYIRTNGGEVSEAMPRNVLILETSVDEIGPYGRLDIDVQGEGNALLFRSGRVYPGEWSKSEETDSYVFTNERGDPLIFASGQTWITVVDTLQRIDWEL